ncbi:hypothetical protein JCM24511_02763 [Saitozyma sp. JCM 24511]|nr:hypothetical protein JCM24511_02763 [Saitozyma sp. JCM 24511]
MSDLKSWSSLLETTVLAPRLSGSKVQSLSSSALALSASGQDTELVTIFYKLNGSLPPGGQSRVSSLYVFDAIARAARSAAGKGKGKAGGAATGAGGLVNKMEGVVDRWVKGMVDDGKGNVWAEGKEKMRKILEIWTKGQTFPQVTLDKLSAIVAGPSAGPSASNSATPIAGASSVAANGATPAAPVLSPGLPPLELPGMDRTRSGTGPREGELIAVLVFPVLCSGSGSDLDVVEDVGRDLGVLWSHMSPTTGGYNELSDSNVERLPWPARNKTKTSIYLARNAFAQEVQVNGVAAVVLTPPGNIWHCTSTTPIGTPPATSAGAPGLPPEILKLLGMQAPPPTNGQAATPLGSGGGGAGIDLASLLATVKQPQQPQQPQPSAQIPAPNAVPLALQQIMSPARTQFPPTTSTPTLPAASQPFSPVAGSNQPFALGIDPSQLAALASIAQQSQGPPNVQGQFPPFPPGQGAIPSPRLPGAPGQFDARPPFPPPQAGAGPDPSGQYPQGSQGDYGRNDYPPGPPRAESRYAGPDHARDGGVHGGAAGPGGPGAFGGPVPREMSLGDMMIVRPLLGGIREAAGMISQATEEGQYLGITLVARVGISMIVKVIGIPGGMGGIDPGVHPETLDRDQDHESSIAIGRLLEGGIAMIVVRGISGIATRGMGMGEEEDEQVEEEGGEEDTEIVVIGGDTIAHTHLSRWISNSNDASLVTPRVPIHRITAAMIVAGANPHLQLEPGSPGGRHCPEQRGPEDGGEEDMALDESDDEGRQSGTRNRSEDTSAGLPSMPAPIQETLPPPTNGTAHPFHPPPPGGLPPSALPSQSGGPGGVGGPRRSSGPTLDNFDMTSFNPANPESWATLAKAWEGSVGRQPNQIELMQFLATGSVPDGTTTGGAVGTGTGMAMGGGMGGMGSGTGGMGGDSHSRGMGGMGGMGFGGDGSMNHGGGGGTGARDSGGY